MAVLSWVNYFATKGLDYTVVQIISVVIILVSLIPALRAMSAAKKANGGKITFWHAFFTGGAVVIAAGLIMAISTILWGFTGLSSSYTDDTTVMMPPVEQGVIMFLLVLFFGSIFSLISAAIHTGRNA